MEKITLFNVGEAIKYQDGVKLYRYPRSVIKELGYLDKTKGKEKAKLPMMCEIRIDTDQDFFEISLKALDCDTNIYVYVNDFQWCNYLLHKGKKETHRFILHERFIAQKEDLCKDGIYHIRILFSSASRIVYYGQYEEIDNKSLPFVLYGSSISQGAGAHEMFHSYAYQLRNHLGVDILNKALSGSCLLERKVVRYLASLKSRGYILEIGCNVRGVMDQEEFKKRFSYLMNTLIKKHPHIPIFVINILEVYESLYKGFKNIPYHERNIEFIKVIQDKIERMNKHNIYLISGKDLIHDMKGITTDLVHPSDLGHEEMARNLANIINKYIKEED